MKRRILIRPAAENDLDEQAEYLAVHRDLDTGLRFYRAAEETLELLASQPEMGKVTKYLSPYFIDARMFPLHEFPKHLIFYRPVENGIEVIRVLHGARDLEKLFET
ncbi:MAG TPA: type II toxin-antitoxin system RelE/ParE family toxin [Terriglobia bacterium]|nr:type II toxin-antitoxin system RelE/ParE family toxin [Terriglobia bacterium]